MPEHSRSSISIGQLNLRMPGDGADATYRVANGIGQSLAQRLPAGAPRNISALNIRIQVGAGASEAETSDAVASAIVKALGNRASNRYQV
jgi:hypothetical protein